LTSFQSVVSDPHIDHRQGDLRTPLRLTTDWHSRCRVQSLNKSPINSTHREGYPMFRGSFGNARSLRKIGSLLLLALLVQLLFVRRASADDLGMWLDKERATATSKMLGNILLSGAVMAAPSRQPDYMFHWTRDGALTTNVVFMLYDK